MIIQNFRNDHTTDISNRVNELNKFAPRQLRYLFEEDLSIFVDDCDSRREVQLKHSKM
jgi:hypothetical protein